MTKLKNIIAVGVCTGLAAAVLAACGSTEPVTPTATAPVVTEVSQETFPIESQTETAATETTAPESTTETESETIVVPIEDELETIIASGISPAYAAVFANAHVDERYVPEAMLGTQVVAGTNYAFLCGDTNTEAEQKFSVVVIYEDFNGSPEVTDIIPVDIAALPEGVQTSGSIPGGWNNNDEWVIISLPQAVQAAVDEYSATLGEDTTCDAVLYMAKVSDEEYAVLGHIIDKSGEGVESGFVVITMDYNDSTMTTTGIRTLDLSNLLS